MQLPDGPSSDRHAWAAAAGEHGREVYRDDNNNVDIQQQRSVRLQHLAQREIEAGWQLLAVKFHDFLNALASAKMCKQPGSDGVVVEMVRALSWSTLLWLYLLFLVRLGGWERPDAWREVVLTAIPKKSDKVGFRSMRYISLLLVIQKFNIRALQSAGRRERKPNETNILGYEPGRSTAGVTATLRQVLSKAAEWGVRAFVASADVEGAFDCIKHDDVEMALKVFILNPSALFCANPVISRVELICLVLRCRLLSCMLVVLGREAWNSLTCGIRFWTMHSENLLVAGNRMELASCSPKTTEKPKRGAEVHLVTL